MNEREGWRFWALVCCWLFAAASAVAAQAPATVRSGPTSRTSLGLTIYNSNFGLVRETRLANLPSGTVQLDFEGVPSSIEPATVHLGNAPGVTVLDQSYEYDVLDPERLLQSYVGKQMTLVFRERVAGSTQEKLVPALLLSAKGPVWKIGNEIVTGIHPDGYRFPGLPAQLHSRPTLLWTLDDARAGTRPLTVSYLTGGMNWNADYILDLTPDGTRASLSGWVTLANNSGASFENAALSLVAGQVNRATPAPQPVRMMAMQGGVGGGVAQQFVQAPIGEYHLYTLNRRISLADRESKQIGLLSAPNVPMTETYVVSGNSSYFRMPVPVGAPAEGAVQVVLSFRNDAAAGLGQPLPAGVVRVYQPDARGELILLGEASISHTPKDETVRLNVGNAFDITSRRTQTDFRRISNNVYESAFAVTLRNHKDKPVTVEVREPVNGSWEVLESNFPAKKRDAFTLEFDVPVPASGSATLTYRVRVTD